MCAQSADDATGARSRQDHARAIGLHHPGGVLHAQDRTAEINGDSEIDVIDHRARDRSRGADDTSVVEHNVEPAQTLDRHVDAGGNVLLRSDIAPDEEDGRAEFVRQAGAGFALDVRDHDPAPLGGEPPYRSRSNTAGPPGDQRGLTLQLAVSLTAFAWAG